MLGSREVTQGMSKAEVIAALGEPEAKVSMADVLSELGKQGNLVIGRPGGDTETWGYKLPDCTLEIYFEWGVVKSVTRRPR